MGCIGKVATYVLGWSGLVWSGFMNLNFFFPLLFYSFFFRFFFRGVVR